MKFTKFPRFERDFKKLPETIKAEVESSLRLFFTNPFGCPASFEDKKMVNQKMISAEGQVRSFRPHRDYRIIYERRHDEIILHNVKHRREVYK